jgi:hypothetical protein
LPRVIITAQVKDPVKWEEGFRKHMSTFFQNYSIKDQIDFTVDGNESVICAEVGDMDVFQKGMASQATADAMDAHGVKRETAKVYVLDKGIKL